MSSSLSRFSGWRSRSLSLGDGLTDSTGARDGTRADGVLAGAGFFLFSVLLGRRATGRSRPAPGVVAIRWGFADSPNLITSDLTDALTLFIARASAMLIYQLSAALQGLQHVARYRMSLSGTRRIVSNVAFVENI